MSNIFYQICVHVTVVMFMNGSGAQSDDSENTKPMTGLLISLAELKGDINSLYQDITNENGTWPGLKKRLNAVLENLSTNIRFDEIRQNQTTTESEHRQWSLKCENKDAMTEIESEFASYQFSGSFTYLKNDSRSVKQKRNYNIKFDGMRVKFTSTNSLTSFNVTIVTKETTMTLESHDLSESENLVIETIPGKFLAVLASIAYTHFRAVVTDNFILTELQNCTEPRHRFCENYNQTLINQPGSTNELALVHFSVNNISITGVFWESLELTHPTEEILNFSTSFNNITGVVIWNYGVVGNGSTNYTVNNNFTIRSLKLNEATADLRNKGNIDRPEVIEIDLSLSPILEDQYRNQIFPFFKILLEDRIKQTIQKKFLTGFTCDATKEQSNETTDDLP